jgi:aminoglycoside phosphotransferase (APT) family kinase protein
MAKPSPDPAAELLPALMRLGLAEAGDTLRCTPLDGGVSSDIWRVTLGDRTFCVKRALARLKVAADWQAPVERNAYEAAWMRFAGAVEPKAVPALLGQDEAAGLLVMAYLAEAHYRSWKTMLQAGEAEPAVAAEVGRRLGRIHAASAGDADLAARFATDRIFHDIRLEPYLLATAARHPDLAPALHWLLERTAGTRQALVHGDVSPKNLLIGPDGPVFLDAECAWYGDPAFDLAFCLNHLLLKCLWTPMAAPSFLACFDALAAGYFEHVRFENRTVLESRAATLLPGLLLARVDGKSPVEYLTGEAEREQVRQTARRLLTCPVARLGEIRAAWAEDLGVTSPVEDAMPPSPAGGVTTR